MTSYRVALQRSDGLVLQDAPLTALLETPVAHLTPWREVNNHPGQMNLTGLHYLAKTGEHVPYESRLEQFALQRLDHDPTVVRVAAQPFLLRWMDGEETLGHVPDFLVERVRRPHLLVDVKPHAFVDTPDNRTAFTATRDACERVGWEYAVWSEPTETYLLNLRWLAAYFRTPYNHDVYRPALLNLLRNGPRPIGELVTALEPECLVRPSLYHLLWCREVLADLEVLLDDHVSVRVA